MKCCNQEHNTPYCPYCGKQLCDSPLHATLYGLICHCIKNRDIQRNKAFRLQQQLDGSDRYTGDIPLRKKTEEAIKRSMAITDKWSRWIEGIEKLLEKRQ